MGEHLRFAGTGEAAQREALAAIIRGNRLLMDVLTGLRDERVPQGMLVAGALYNSVWNHLTGRPALHGINDIDIAYFDDADISYEAEDAVIKAFDRRFGGLPVPVQVRNQARVHLWFEAKFGAPFAPLDSAKDMLGRYASKTHAVAAWLDDADALHILAPFGLEPIFSFRIVPNRVLDNRRAHTSKGERSLTLWPELRLEPWPDEDSAV